MAGRGRLAVAALASGMAAALSSWNPLAAPFGLLVGLAAAVLALRALRRGARRVVAIAALVVSLGAVGASGVVLALTAGVGRDLVGEPVVHGPSGGGAEHALDEAAERTGASRKRARDELGKVGGE
ncbi:MAG TPA: hypothetical protein VFG59_07650 [Anaeromyxobacter sp.]|nr:hypothetical protein [Anaeromyxobacter sp.]